ncbi:peptidyl-tRNA hydrolase [Sediminibacterium goheungense]|uniref:Peptidyl-tRNA hydrolase n=2 Tax=Sediminibacterium goheungense TaxID=1086393 RepID=A0A4V3C571_9BACT|nr:peptidyl-tRNA hydrolase [Sediminibacterium goheungense]
MVAENKTIFTETYIFISPSHTTLDYFCCAMNKFLIIGLGNIGEEYRHTRHNIGFDVVTAFVLRHNAFFKLDRLAEVAEVKWKGRTFICIKPTTYMNLSGKAFKYWMDKEKIELANTLTIVDDLALPLNKIRLRGSGSDAGHNGLKDIQLTLGTDQYPKLRFGIGNQYPKGRQVDFVLGRWLPEEQAIVQQKIDKSVEIIESFATIGLEKTMNTANNMNFL